MFKVVVGDKAVSCVFCAKGGGGGAGGMHHPVDGSQSACLSPPDLDWPFAPFPAPLLGARLEGRLLGLVSSLRSSPTIPHPAAARLQLSWVRMDRRRLKECKTCLPFRSTTGAPGCGHLAQPIAKLALPRDFLLLVRHCNCWSAKSSVKCTMLGLARMVGHKASTGCFELQRSQSPVAFFVQPDPQSGTCSKLACPASLRQGCRGRPRADSQSVILPVLKQPPDIHSQVDGQGNGNKGQVIHNGTCKAHSGQRTQRLKSASGSSSEQSAARARRAAMAHPQAHNKVHPLRLNENPL